MISLSASEINGTWNLSGEHPIRFNGIIGYSFKIDFKNDGTFTLLGNRSSITKTVHRYKIKNNKLDVYLENKNIGLISTFMLRHSSASQAFILQKQSTKCYLAIDKKISTNKFIMCKED